MFTVLIIWQCYISSWGTLCLVPTYLKCRLKLKSTPSTRAFHLTEMRPSLVLVRKGVYPIIQHLQHFTKYGLTVSPTWRRTQSPLLPQLDKSHTMPQEYTFDLNFPHSSLNFQGPTHQIIHRPNLYHTQFFSFTLVNLLEI